MLESAYLELIFFNPTIYDEREFDARRESAFLHEVLTGPLIVLRGT
jgi:hypothetical protein